MDVTKIIQKGICLAILGGLCWFFGMMLLNIDWSKWNDATIFVCIGLLMEAVIAIGAVGAALYGAYMVIVRM